MTHRQMRGKTAHGAMNLIEYNWMVQLEAVVAVLIAAVLGGLVGWERELADRPAGLRTHAILSASACLLVTLADLLVSQVATESAPSLLRADPIRVVEAVVTGTAFLGAGTIFRHHNRKEVEGLTTAASLLLVAGIGIAVALRQLIVALLVTALAWGLLHAVEQFLKRNTDRHE